MSIFSKKHAIGIATACLFAIIFSFSTPFVMVANALESGDPGVGGDNVIEVATNRDKNTTMMRIKTYVLDPLAWAAAKSLVQKITADTVQWINSGFKGQPAFLTNPEGFALSVADQATGEFISKSGILSNLCSPFNVDVRLALALDMAGYNQNVPYECTLSTIINNAANPSINGNSIAGFLNGDFNQGGWQGFIAAGNPANNPGRVYLQAQSDLLQKIGVKQNKFQQQLLQGGGFMSWQDCKSVSAAQVQSAAGASADVSAIGIRNSGGASGTEFLTNNSTGAYLPAEKSKIPNQNMLARQGISQTSVVNSQGVTQNSGFYESCETKTPGSVINAQLSKQLGSGIDQLNLAQSLNQIISSLMSQLVSQVLHKGLATASQKPSGSLQSYINELSAQANSSTTYSQSGQSIQGTFTPYINTAQSTANTYGRIVTYFNNTKLTLDTAKTCLQDLKTKVTPINNGYNTNTSLIADVQRILSNVDQTISEIAPIIVNYQSKYDISSTNLAAYKQMATDASKINNAGELQNAGQALTNFINTQSSNIEQGRLAAEADSITSTSQLTNYDGRANQYLNQCRMDGGI